MNKHLTIGFSGQFVGKVKDGSKAQTIREDSGERSDYRRAARWLEAGYEVRVNLASGNRYRREQRVIRKARLLSCEPMQMWRDFGRGIVYADIGSGELSNCQIASLAKQDGFDRLDEFDSWFLPKLPKDGSEKQFHLLKWEV